MRLLFLFVVLSLFGGAREDYFSNFSALKEEEKWEEIAFLGNEALAWELSSEERALIHAQLASNAYYLGEYEAFEKHVEECYGIASDLADASLLLRSMYLLSARFRSQANFADARLWSEKALSLITEETPSYLQGKIHFNAGAAHADDPLGDLSAAKKYYLAAISLFEEADSLDRTWIRLGKVYLLQKKFSEALEIVDDLDPEKERTLVHLLYLKAQIHAALLEESVEKAIEIADRLGMKKDKMRLQKLKRPG